MEKLDYKKAEKHLYQPKGPAILRVPEMVFFAVEGSGDPNTSASYREALELLYGLSFTVKMSKLGAGPCRATSSTWCRRWRACGGRTSRALTAGP